jgi:curli biogenesis system outer membrane secretion channel CsgG
MATVMGSRDDARKRAQGYPCPDVRRQGDAMHRVVMACLAFVIAAPAWSADPVAPAAEAPVLAVLKFQDETGGMILSGGVGRALTTMLTNELAARARFTVVERRKLRDVMEEQNLSLSGRVDEDASITIGRLTGAKFLVTGTITAYEEKVKTSIKRGFLGAGGGIREESEGGYLAVDLRVIDTTTGTIARARTVEGRTEGSVREYRFSEGRGGVAALDNGPGAKAVRAAVIEIIDYLECEMIVRDGCRADYADKDAQRIETTRRALRIDDRARSPENDHD